ncbi:MAG: hypothetical protein MR428_04840 [Mesosutterella sp.]|uniref:Uncharacterized protein n=1 Tax=Mesosutterella faecium TaxID=2925194 RepID=A0ABT7IJ93_9BURK|nr:hypothetical protein [Mesosutterella sp. AGMB02718]MCI6530405.1 hypothetical protein [Mesosutterella sp.]MDL2058437.1 hypothetical protein [Mesosutterella sp. AGMB02718]
MAASQAPAGQPPGILITGNSYSYYNCGADEVLRGLMRETRLRLRSKVTLEAVRAAPSPRIRCRSCSGHAAASRGPAS